MLAAHGGGQYSGGPDGREGGRETVETAARAEAARKAVEAARAETAVKAGQARTEEQVEQAERAEQARLQRRVRAVVLLQAWARGAAQRRPRSARLIARELAAWPAPSPQAAAVSPPAAPPQSQRPPEALQSAAVGARLRRQAATRLQAAARGREARQSVRWMHLEWLERCAGVT